MSLSQIKKIPSFWEWPPPSPRNNWGPRCTFFPFFIFFVKDLILDNCRLQSWTLYKSANCRWISITILCVSFTNSATVRRLEQVQLCNRLIDQSADNIIGLKCAKECLILKYRYIQNPWLTPKTSAGGARKIEREHRRRKSLPEAQEILRSGETTPRTR